MRIITSSLFFLLLLFLPLEALAGPRIALVIGNGAYKSTSPLSNPPNDARLIGHTLRKLNFKLVGDKAHINVGRRKMRDLIRDFERLLKKNKNTVGLFYYSGHGMEVKGRNYMIPVGADIQDEVDVREEAVGINSVLGRMEAAKNVMNFVILDACRNNTYEKSFKSAGNGLAEMIKPQGSLIAFAAEPHKVALQGLGKYSYFTEALAKEMLKPGISVSDMFTNVRITVHEATKGRQVPITENGLLAHFSFNSDTTEKFIVPPLFTDPDIPEEIPDFPNPKREVPPPPPSF